MDQPYRQFEITLRGKIGTESGGSGDFGWSDLATETGVEATLSDVVGYPPNVERATDLYNKLKDDKTVVEVISERIILDLPSAIQKALVEDSRNG